MLSKVGVPGPHASYTHAADVWILFYRMLLLIFSNRQAQVYLNMEYYCNC